MLQRVNVQVEGAAAFAHGGTALINLDKIQPLRRIPGGTTYLHRLVFTWRGTYTSDASAGNLTMDNEHAHDIFDSIFVRIPGRAWPVYELPNRAGSHLRAALHALTGRRPMAANGGASGQLTIAEAGTAVRLTLELPFYCPYSIEPGDWGIPLALVQNQSQVLIGWAAAGLFGTDMNAGSNVSGTLTCQAELIERPEFRVPTAFSIQSMELSGVQDQLPLAQRVLHAVLEVPVHGNALTNTVISDANRDLITVTIDGHDVVRQIDARDQNVAWNLSYARTRDDELTAHEAGTTPFVPWFMPFTSDKGDDARLSKLPLCIGQPQFVVTGTDTTPRVVCVSTELNTKQSVLTEVARSGVQVPPGLASSPESFMTVKTASKSPARPGADVAARMPIRIHQQRVAA